MATLKVQTELFAQHAGAAHPDFLPLALTLLPLVDEATAREVAKKLCPLPQTPVGLIEAFFARGGGVAETVVAEAPNLPEHLRQTALEHVDPRIPARLAARADLTDAEQLHIVGRAEAALSLALAQNGSIRIGRAVAAGLISAARQDHVLAQAVLSRDDIDSVAWAPLYAAADQAQRAMIRGEIERRIIARAISLPHREATEAEQARLMEASLDGMPALIADLALVSERESNFVSAAALDASREIVALALVGLGLMPEDTTRILLRTGDAVARDSRALHALVNVIRSTSAATAEMIIGASWPRHDHRAQARHVPVMAPGGTSSRAAPGATRKSDSRQIIDQARLRS